MYRIIGIYSRTFLNGQYILTPSLARLYSVANYFDRSDIFNERRN